MCLFVHGDPKDFCAQKAVRALPPRVREGHSPWKAPKVSGEGPGLPTPVASETP